MKNMFIYPTKLNMFYFFVFAQVFPVISLYDLQKFYKLEYWLMFELVIIGTIILWKQKPDNEKDEREVILENKWLSRSFNWGSNLLAVPVLLMCLKPDMPAVYFFTASVVPVYIFFVIITYFMKRELGYFFIKNS